MTPRLALFELHHLGDAVMAIPFIKAAGRKFDVTVFCSTQVAELLKVLMPGLSLRPLPVSWGARLREVRAGDAFDVAACVWPDVRAQTLMLATRADIRAGFSVEETNFYAPEIPWRKRRLTLGRLGVVALEKSLGKPVLTHALKKLSPRQHHLESWRQLGEALEVDLDLTRPWLDCAGFPDVLQRGPGPVVALHPGGRLPTKRWTGYQEILRDFFAPRNLPVRILVPPGEPAPEPCGPNQILVPCPDFETFAAVLAASDILLANDSFAAHLATAFGKPVVSVFGSGEPDWFAPYGNESLVVCSRACPHHPCIDRCVMPSFVCLEAITEALVAGKLQEALDAWGAKPTRETILRAPAKDTPL